MIHREVKSCLFMVIVLAIVAAVGCAEVMNQHHIERDAVIPMNKRVADLLRMAVMVQAGICLGMSGIILRHLRRLTYEPFVVTYVKMIAGIIFVFFTLTLYICFDLLDRLSDPWVTWRTPLGLVTFAGSFVILVAIRRKLNRTHPLPRGNHVFDR